LKLNQYFYNVEGDHHKYVMPVQNFLEV